VGGNGLVQALQEGQAALLQAVRGSYD